MTSRSLTRFLATSALLVLALGFGAESVLASSGAPAPLPVDTWTALGAIPGPRDTPVFALAAGPSGRDLLVGAADGGIYRSLDGGARWTRVRRPDGRAVASIAFSPFTAGLALAGTQGDGVLTSTDGGASWRPDAGSAGTTVRGFGFARSATLAGTDQGVMLKLDGGAWSSDGLARLSVSTVAAAVSDHALLLAGGDASTGQEGLPLYASSDGGATWTALEAPPSAGSMVSVLAAGPRPPGTGDRPLLLGTNSGAFESSDNGATWSPLSALPSTDINQAIFVGAHPDRFYLASDGGGAAGGGLWYTGDGGHSFRSLAPPFHSVTALAVNGDQAPTVYVATFGAADHATTLWAYHDLGGKPKGPAAARVTVSTAGARRAGAPRPQPLDWKLALARGPEAPYLALGAAALLVLLIALGAYVARGRA
ncbi:MAG: WD40/YVTN/BNR-like repeat-containing protein [Candidatus Dormibacteraceae bacterium]